MRDLAGLPVRAAAAELLERALSTKSPVERLLEPARAGRSKRDRALLHHLVYGSLRWLLKLDDVIERASGRPIGKIDRKLLSPMRIATYQLLFLDRVPAHAVVDEAVETARRRTHRGGGAFANAVLRKIAVKRSPEQWPAEGTLVDRLAIETSHPKFLVERWLERWGEEATRSILEANNRPKPTHLLAFADWGGRDALAAELAESGVETRRSEISPFGLVVTAGDPRETPAFREGRAYIQDEAAQASALVPVPRAGEQILDAAAAPGGKSFAILAAEPTVRIVAADRRLERLVTLTQNSRRLSRPLRVVAHDAARPALSPQPGFDRVIVDYPCTGTGTFRKHPELKWRVDPSEIDRLAKQAYRLLCGVAGLVGPGGLLVGISCSIESEENEAWVERFLEEHDDFELRPGVPNPWQLLPAADHDGLTVHSVARKL